jgi:hypothetical protein
VKNLEKRAEFLVFGKPDIQDQEIDEVIACLKSGWIGTGPRVDTFESQFRKYKQAGNAVAMNSCTAGLHLSFEGINSGASADPSALQACDYFVYFLILYIWLSKYKKLSPLLQIFHKYTS